MSELPTIRAGIIGAAGLSAGKLIGLLLKHPNVTLHTLVSESSPGKSISTAHPELRGKHGLIFDPLDFEKLSQCDVVFSCKKAGDTFTYIERLLETGVRVIDLSGDYRLADAAHYPSWYGLEHQFPQFLKTQMAVYGMPELYRDEIRQARLVANPGCYTTASILACAPFVAAGYGNSSPIIIDAVSGVSGAGRNAKAENQFLAVSDNVRAYRVGTHQHTPEIEQELNYAASRGGRQLQSTVLFVPHVGPYKVGILADCFIAVGDQPMLSSEDAYEILSQAYKDEPFVRIFEPATLPQVDHVRGTNFCDIGVTVDARTKMIVAVSATDNLLKGAAGQAVQNMNLMFDIDETVSLL